MKRLLFVLVLLLAVQSAFAQRELVTSFGRFNTQLGQWCGNIDDWGLAAIPQVSDATTWVCSMRPAMDRAANVVNVLTQDSNNFFANSLGTLMEMTGLGAGGFVVGGVDVGALANAASSSVQDAIATGEFAFSPLVNRVVAEVNAARVRGLTDAAPENASSYEKAIDPLYRRDPNRIAAELTEMNETSSSIRTAAQAQDLSVMARESAVGAFARGDEEQLLKRTTSPNPASIAKGAADKAQDLARTANSSRAVFHANVQMVADAARLYAVGTSNITTAIKESALQQTYTTQQLATMIQMMADDQRKQSEAWRDDYIENMSEVHFLTTQLRNNLQATADLLRMP